MDERIARLTTPKDARTFAKNAAERGRPDLETEALDHARTLQALQEGHTSPAQQAIATALYAYEEAQSQLKGRTFRANRTRQMIANRGALAAAERMVLNRRPSQGYEVLEEAGLQELSFEAIIVRFPNEFSSQAVRAAQARLDGLPSPPGSPPGDDDVEEIEPTSPAVFDDDALVFLDGFRDPDTWYHGKYTDTAKYGTREEHYQMWEGVMRQYPGVPWVGAHMGGNPEDLGRLQDLLDRYPDLVLDCSATRWMVREISARRDAAREFFIRNQDRIFFGSDQVSGDDRGFDFLASRWWAHRKLWETAFIGPTPIFDPDLPEDQQPQLRSLALPDEVLQKLYHDNAVKFLARVGVSFEGWG